MDEDITTTLSNALVESPEYSSTMWTIPDDIRSQQKPRADILAMPERLNEVPEWLRTPLRRFLRLKQRNWPAKTVQRSTRQLFNRLKHMISFFIQHYEWIEWKQFSPRWLEDYIDARLRRGIAPGTINWDLIYFRAFCQFLIDEGFDVPTPILKLKVLDTPRRLPRPLSAEQIRRLEKCIQTAITEAKTDSKWIIAVRALACFYLLWHCGLRISEVCSLRLNDIDIEARKLFIRNSKERKDRIAYMSDTAARVKAQKALDKSERLYRALYESANDAIFLLDMERIYIAANRRTTDLLGYRLDEFVGMGVKDIVAPYEYSDAMTKLDILLERGTLPLYERIFKRKDGTEVPVEINVSLIADQDGEPLYIQSIARDITERKRAEKDLKEVNRSLKVLSECNQVLIRTTQEQDLLDKICGVIVQEGGYHLAWVGYAEQDEPKSVRTIAQAGLEGRYFDNLVISWADDTKGQGPAGTAIRTGKPVIVTDMRSYPHHAPWFPRALESGAVASIALPLRANGTSLGVLNICSKDSDSFHSEEVKLLCELADDLAFGVVTLRMRAEHQTAGEKIKHQVKKLEALRNIDVAITSSLDLRVTFDILLSETTGILGVDAAAVLSYSPQSQTLDFVTGKGFSTTALQHTHLRLGESHAGQAALERRTIHIKNLNQQNTGFLRSPFLGQENFSEYFGVPLIAKGQLKGVLEVFHCSPLNSDPEWLGMLDSLAGQAAIAMDNLELFQNLQKSHTDVVIAYDSTLEGWSGALDLRDKETEGHTQRVTELSLHLARAMGIDNKDLVNIRRGALLHDIGKMGIPDSILLKPGPLSEEEWEIMRKHPTYAFKLLSPISYLRPALEIPYCHHEKWDGTGYPRGLKGEEIPLAARIFAVIDVWDALRSDRPYRKAWSEEKTLEFIKEQTGKHFDPKVVTAFLGLDQSTRSGNLGLQ